MDMFNLAEYWVELGGLKNGFFSRKNFYRIGIQNFAQSYKNFIKKYNNTDVYQCVYFYDSKDDIDNSVLYGGFYLDLDGDINSNAGYDELKSDVSGAVAFFKSIGLRENEIKIYFSGSKGFHIEIAANTLGIIPDKNLNVLYKAWALYLHNVLSIKNIDLKIYDRRRLFRIADSVNGKTGLYKKRITLDQALKYSHEEMCEYAKNTIYNVLFETTSGINKMAAINFYNQSKKLLNQNRKEKTVQVVIPKTKQELLPCVKVLLETGAQKGYRNNTLVLLSSAVLQSGYSLDETIQIMNSWNELNDPPMNEKEIELTTKSAYSMLLTGKKYGCTAFKELGYCIDNNCKLGDNNKR